ncbi:MAG: hypothetical protein IAE91_09255 [Ignavibacteriaceae bacterium]|nr:hypothetical protein [Ignavibacteriaceae bacterium]
MLYFALTAFIPDSFLIRISGLTFILIILFVLAVLFSFYVYRVTVPPLLKFKKILLFSIRTSILLIVVSLIFEPVVSLGYVKEIRAVNYLFIDNSLSMADDETGEKKLMTLEFAEEALKQESNSNLKVITFDATVNSAAGKDSFNLNFSGSNTNFASIFTYLEESKENIASVSIFSDGVMTAGSDPVFRAAKMKVPVFTVGVGDTIRKNDISVTNAVYSETMYLNSSADISVSVRNDGFKDITVPLTLFEENTPVQTINVNFSESETKQVIFNYTPKSEGEKKLSVFATPQKGEKTELNNRYPFFVTVLSNKIKIVLLAGSPGADISFITNSLQLDTNYTVSSFIQAGSKFLENKDPFKSIDSAEVLFLINFPGKNTPAELLNRVKSLISERNIPFFVLVTENTDILKLKVLEPDLPFTFSGSSQVSSETMPVLDEGIARNPIIRNNSNDVVKTWNNLPPVLRPNLEATARVESEVIARSKINNVSLNYPLIMSRKLGYKRSIAVLAGEIWRWKLKNPEKDSDLFDRFILNSAKWLNSGLEKKQFIVRTGKKIYAGGETIDFSAQLLDDSFEPVNDAQIKVNYFSATERGEIILNREGTGIYGGNVEGLKSGDYSFEASAIVDGKNSGADRGRFNIGDLNLELSDTHLNKEFLKSLSNQTGGKYYDYQQTALFFENLKQLSSRPVDNYLSKSEYTIWSNRWVLFLLIFLFCLEWFLRKREGLN